MVDDRQTLRSLLHLAEIRLEAFLVSLEVVADRGSVLRLALEKGKDLFGARLIPIFGETDENCRANTDDFLG